jgi:hypothetical protein
MANIFVSQQLWNANKQRVRDLEEENVRLLADLKRALTSPVAEPPNYAKNPPPILGYFIQCEVAHLRDYDLWKADSHYPINWFPFLFGIPTPYATTGMAYEHLILVASNRSAVCRNVRYYKINAVAQSWPRSQRIMGFTSSKEYLEHPERYRPRPVNPTMPLPDAGDPEDPISYPSLKFQPK